MWIDGTVKDGFLGADARWDTVLHIRQRPKQVCFAILIYTQSGTQYHGSRARIYLPEIVRQHIFQADRSRYFGNHFVLNSSVKQMHSSNKAVIFS